LLQAAVQAGELKIDQPLNWATHYFNDREPPVPSAIDSQAVETMHMMLTTFPTVLRRPATDAHIQTAAHCR